MSVKEVDGLHPHTVVVAVKAIEDPVSGKRIEGYSFTVYDMRTRPDWVDRRTRLYVRQVERYLKVGVIE